MHSQQLNEKPQIVFTKLKHENVFKGRKNNYNDNNNLIYIYSIYIYTKIQISYKNSYKNINH